MRDKNGKRYRKGKGAVFIDFWGSTKWCHNFVRNLKKVQRRDLKIEEAIYFKDWKKQAI
jgi:hypothetical protein